MDKRESAKHFLKMVAFGEVRPAYDKYIAKNFIHHNQYFKSDRESLMTAMEQAHQTHPNKVFDIKKCYLDQDTVVTHSHLQLKADAPQMSAVHIMRFEGDKIVEMWDVVQMLEKNSPNEKGAF